MTAREWLLELARPPNRARPAPQEGANPPPPRARSATLSPMRRPALAAVALAALAACGSSAPYTVPAAAVNTGLALGLAGAQRAGGGCYAVCTNGTVCNPRNGLCESAKADVYCEAAPGGGMRCVPLQIGKERPASQPSAGVGVSPATGTVPPSPAEASPRSGP